ncbi:MAG: phosphate acyltransferase [Gammaproteobacteria bacterium]|jgi:glycerol-3-phosphate acyltransferase PlsX|nr:phosphate acyltransferase [Gammaproteobacteria bacterium]|tara:strand:- start:2764 stop:3789 length:1026 start_codon:yes stop_codon:yes gene_type:complete
MHDNITIALDMMSGDDGVASSVPGAIQALNKHQDLFLILVGNKTAIENFIPNDIKKLENTRYNIIHTNELISMQDEVLTAIRSKKQSSMRLSIEAVNQNKADACVSAGNTGALMALSKIILKMLQGIDRPAICGSFPTKDGLTHMLDLGANVQCNSNHLYQFAIMGSALVQSLEISNSPKIGLLNVGSEEFKGNDTIKHSGQLLQKSKLNYAGFVEGDDIFTGNFDLVVTDGFAGNIALKSIEGVANIISHFIKSEFNKNIFTKISAAISYPVMKAVKKKVDPRRYNGASLLGLQGVVVKSHGSADPYAFSRAINTAYYEVKNQILNKITNLINTEMSDAK